ncbi:hypothetical protein MEQU1_002952 [Malassezia equina]|uniref:Uncharacterized protein n=1 Tax=Malassezia equina TaxID=1381935 RepID=A0AAF0EEM0_9BASI|nr:hypothetical protein MEQU1_002952 [Malassezia equina]
MFASSPLLDSDDAPRMDTCTDSSWKKADFVSPGVSKRNDLSPLEQLCSGMPSVWPQRPSGPLDVHMGSGILRMPNVRATKVSMVQHVRTLGRQHGSIRLKTESVYNSDQVSKEYVLPERSETPLCTKIARKRPSLHKKPRRKPAPPIGDPCPPESVQPAENAPAIDYLPQVAPVRTDGPTQLACLGQVAPIEPVSVPPPRPQKNMERVHGHKAPGHALWYLSQGMIPIVPPPRPRKSSMRLASTSPWTDTPRPAPGISLPDRHAVVPELDPDSDSDSIPSSVEEPVL